MSVPLTGLSLVAFVVGTNDLLARLRTADLAFDNEQAEGKGARDRYDYAMNVKQGQKLDFTVFKDATGKPGTNLNVTVWTIGGTDFLTSCRGGNLSVTTKTDEGSYIAEFNKVPVAVGTGCEISIETMQFTNAALARTMAAGTVASFDVTVVITYAGETFNAPMTLKGTVVKVDREKITMQNATLTLKGTPTAPNTTTLLGAILLGTAAVGLAYDTGGDAWYTGEGQYCLITKLDIRFADAAIIEQTGTLEVQGPIVADDTGELP